ncbi:hypothetical protein [Paraburkholderia ferrariae]|uniref:hypothetical protein n=1 Tax=Paraburkholderia ferrariae TaxID=386056 RepID=UPI0004801B0D|nr:hypothetical protein [Paraburkholderia ferrariae]
MDLANAQFDFQSGNGSIKVTSRTLVDAQNRALSNEADGMVSFMQLFHRMGEAGAQGMFKDGPYYAPNGTKIDLTQNPGSTSGFLNFMQSTQVMAYGTDTYVGAAGHTMFAAAQFDVFDGSALPNFFPSRATSVGMHETA